MMGLDHLEALVHQRRRVDRDLRPHRPGRVRERLLGRDAARSCCARAAAERAARGGDREPLDRARAVGALGRRSAARARRARSRPAGCARRSPRRAPSRARRPTTSDSLLASARSIPSPSATTVGPRPAEPTIALSTRSAPAPAISSITPIGPASTSPSGHAPAALAAACGSASAIRPMPSARACATTRSQFECAESADDLEALRAGDDVERLHADRAGARRGSRGASSRCPVSRARRSSRRRPRTARRRGGRALRRARRTRDRSPSRRSGA